MDEAHFGLRHKPFRNTLDSEWYYPATGHEHALSRLLQAHKDGEGYALLTGEPGSGKTFVCHRLLEKLGDVTVNAFLTNGHFCGRAGFLQAILHELKLPYEGRNEQELRLALTQFLLESFAAASRVLLLIDETHHLTPDMVEELRLLGNVESRNGQAMQVVLVAQPAFADTLALPVLASFRQRLGQRISLEPLTLEESVDFLAHHVRTAGGRPEKVFSEEALEVIARACRGLPRLLNQAGRNALDLAFSVGEKLVDVEITLEALAAHGLQTESEEEPILSAPAATEEEPAPGPVLMVEEDDKTEQCDAASTLERERRIGRLFAGPRRPA